MDAVTTSTLIGAWISIFLTLCVLSFLYDDNPVYKLAEHLFLGVSIGISVTEIYYGVFEPNLAAKLMPGTGVPSLTPWLFVAMAAGVVAISVVDFKKLPEKAPLVLLAGIGLVLLGVLGQLALDWGQSAVREPWTFWRALSFVPLVLVALLFAKLTPKHGWLARFPIAFVVAAYAGVKLTGEANANLMTQVAQTMPDLKASYAANGWWSWSADGGGVISDLVLVVGLCACLIYFYFSAPAKGAMAWVSRFGVLMLMLSFGASFGYTVMGRISLAIGRAQEMLGLDRSPAQVAEIRPRLASVVSLLLIIAFLVWWRRRGGGYEPPTGTGTAGGDAARASAQTGG